MALSVCLVQYVHFAPGHGGGAEPGVYANVIELAAALELWLEEGATLKDVVEVFRREWIDKDLSPG